MEKTYEKSLYNLYKLINNYFIKIKNEYKKEPNTFKDSEQFHSKMRQKVLDYEVSIYKNMESKLLPFAQLFNLKKNNAYTLNDLETKILRLYIGIYTKGNKQSVESISRTLNIPQEKIKKTLKRILNQLLDPFFQEQIIYERNVIISKNIKNEIKGKYIKEKLLKQDISFLLMSNNMQEILKMSGIKTIENLINIDEKKIIDLNKQFGHNAELKIFPKRISKQIYSLGLSFKNEKIFEKINEKYYMLDSIQIEDLLLDIDEHVLYMNTLLDLICAQQFEPEILNTLELNERLQIDKIINNGYIKEQYLSLIKDAQSKVYKQDKRVVKTIEDLVKREYLYLTKYETDIITEDINNIFEIKNNKTEEEKIFLKTYFMEKN